MTDGALTVQDAREKLRQATKAILDLEAEFAAAVERSADAEAVYRHELAQAYRGHRQGGSPVQESETLARADVARLSRERDYAAGMLRLAGEKLEDARDSRRSLWRLMDLSHAAVTGPVQEAMWP